MQWTVITNCDSFFNYKLRHGLLQVATGITKCDGFITNCDRYYKARWLLQIATVQNPHSLIRYVTLTDCLEIHQRLHGVGNQRSRERTPCIKLVSRRYSIFSTGVDWKQVNTPRFGRKLYLRFFFFFFFGGGRGYVNDYSKPKPSKNCQLYLLI